MANINIKRVAEELYALYGSEGLEFFLYADGETGSRQVGSVGRHENKIILTRNVNRNAWDYILRQAGVDEEEGFNEEHKQEILDEIIYLLKHDTNRHTGEPIDWEY